MSRQSTYLAPWIKTTTNKQQLRPTMSCVHVDCVFIQNVDAPTVLVQLQVCACKLLWWVNFELFTHHKKPINYLTGKLNSGQLSMTVTEWAHLAIYSVKKMVYTVCRRVVGVGILQLLSTWLMVVYTVNVSYCRWWYIPNTIYRQITIIVAGDIFQLPTIW